MKRVLNLLTFCAVWAAMMGLVFGQANNDPRGDHISSKANQALEQCFDSMGNFICVAGVPPNNVTGSGTPNVIPKWSGVSTLTDSLLSDVPALNAFLSQRIFSVAPTIGGPPFTLIAGVSSGATLPAMDGNDFFTGFASTTLPVASAGANNYYMGFSGGGMIPAANVETSVIHAGDGWNHFITRGDAALTNFLHIDFPNPTATNTITVPQLTGTMAVVTSTPDFFTKHGATTGEINDTFVKQIVGPAMEFPDSTGGLGTDNVAKFGTTDPMYIGMDTAIIPIGFIQGPAAIGVASRDSTRISSGTDGVISPFPDNTFEVADVPAAGVTDYAILGFGILNDPGTGFLHDYLALAPDNTSQTDGTVNVFGLSVADTPGVGEAIGMTFYSGGKFTDPIRYYDDGVAASFTTLDFTTPTAARTQTFQDASGTIALTSDIAAGAIFPLTANTTVANDNVQTSWGTDDDGNIRYDTTEQALMLETSTDAIQIVSGESVSIGSDADADVSIQGGDGVNIAGGDDETVGSQINFEATPLENADWFLSTFTAYTSGMNGDDDVDVFNFDTGHNVAPTGSNNTFDVITGTTLTPSANVTENFINVPAGYDRGINFQDSTALINAEADLGLQALGYIDIEAVEDIAVVSTGNTVTLTAASFIKFTPELDGGTTEFQLEGIPAAGDPDWNGVSFQGSLTAQNGNDTWNVFDMDFDNGAHTGTGNVLNYMNLDMGTADADSDERVLCLQCETNSHPDDYIRMGSFNQGRIFQDTTGIEIRGRSYLELSTDTGAGTAGGDMVLRTSGGGSDIEIQLNGGQGKMEFLANDDSGNYGIEFEDTDAFNGAGGFTGGIGNCPINCDHPLGSYVFPIDTPIVTTSGVTPLTANNQIIGMRIDLKRRYAMGEFQIEVTTAQVGAVCDVGINNANGSFMLRASEGNSGFDASSTGIKRIEADDEIFVGPGTFWLMFTCSDQNVAVRGVAVDTSFTAFLNDDTGSRWGIASGSASSGILPTSSNNPSTDANFNAPLILIAPK